MNKDTKRLLLFLILSFGIVHLGCLPYTFGKISYYDADGNMTSITNFLLALFMLVPAVSVLITRKITGEGIHLTGDDSLKLGISFKDKKWIFYLLACVVPLFANEIGSIIEILIWKCFDSSVMMDAAREMMPGAGNVEIGLFVLTFPLIAISNAIINSFGGLGEEIGWRGYMMPKLEKKFGILGAVIIGGIIWGAWHYPMILHGHNFGFDYIGAPWSGLAIFTFFTICENAFLTYLFKKTDSIWVAAIAHAVNNAGPTILKTFIDTSKMARFEQDLYVIAFIPSFIVGVICMVKLVRMKNKNVQ